MANIEKESIDSPVQNRVVVVGATAVPINPFEFRFMKGFLLYLPGTLDPTPNTAPVWIGDAKVTADMDADTGGFPLVPGSSLFVPVEFLRDVYAISTMADQHLMWLGV
jgi:hypothetical protein